MRKHFGKLPLAAVLLALVAASCTQMMAGDTATPAPDLTLKTTDGQDLTLTSLKGKVVVLDFWATWCPPCRESLPNLSKLSSDKSLADRGLKVVAIDARESTDQVKHFIEAHQLTLTAALDTDGAAEEAYKIDSFPTTIVIGRDGMIAHTIVGYAGKETEDELNTAIEKALGATAAPTMH